MEHPVKAPDYSPALIESIRLVSHPLLRVLYRYSTTGTERIPAEGPCILAPNHASFLDPWFISYATRRRVYYLAWHGLFGNRLFANLIGRCGARMVNIDSASDSRALRTALRILRDGEVLCIFPEGMRSWDGRLSPLRAGAFRLAAQTNAPILPVWIEGSLESWPRWKKLPRIFTPVIVRVLEPLRPETFEAENTRELADLLRSKTTRALLDASGSGISVEPEFSNRETGL